MTPGETTSCVKSYQSGYHVGQISAENLLRGAYGEGRALKAQGKPRVAFSHPVQGKCGVRQAEAYSSGYFGAPFTMVGK